MAKKSARNDRQAVMDQIRKRQKSADRRRNFVIIGVCAAIAVGILAAAVVPIVKRNLELSEFQGLALSEVGGPASACGEVTTEDSGGNNQHVPETQQVTYPDQAPPAYGDHWNVAGLAPDPMERKFYTAEDRPELEALVHNLEHGYTILWYDETIAEDADKLNTVEALAQKFPGTDNSRHKFKAVPWTAEDAEENGGGFPDGTHIAMTHWAAGGGEPDKALDQAHGVWQYCSEPSGEALEQFMLDWPYLDSPEPNAM